MPENVLLYSPSGSGGSTSIELIDEGEFNYAGYCYNAQANNLVNVEYDKEKYLCAIIVLDGQVIPSSTSGSNRAWAFTGNVSENMTFTGISQGNPGNFYIKGASASGKIVANSMYNGGSGSVTATVKGIYKIYGVIGSVE